MPICKAYRTHSWIAVPLEMGIFNTERDISSGKSTIPLSQTSLFVGLPTEACMAQAHSRVKPGLLSSITHILLPSVHAGHHAGSLKAAQPCRRPPVLSSRRAAALSSTSPAPLPPSSPQQQCNKGLWVPKKISSLRPFPGFPSHISSFTTSGEGKKKEKHNKTPFEHLISGWGLSITKASHWLSVELYFKKASII